ncbi:MAG: 50S ribosomal protein L25 [Verrucomicrobia bacterium]|nr:50S ribosomal protein L25 [Verrucomicrobiota bacterium]
MKLNLEERQGNRKGETNSLRRAGKIPAVTYGSDGKNRCVAVDKSAFQGYLREIRKGCLPTTLFTLVGAEGTTFRALIKEIQYHVTTYDVLHLDFQEVSDKRRVNVRVPLRLLGGAECPGVKGGGVVRQVIGYLRINCLPTDMPSELILDIKDLDLGQTKRLRDVSLPEGVRPLAKMDEVVVVIAKR